MSSCKKDDDIDIQTNNNNTHKNLISNPDFEDNGISTFEGWTGNSFSFSNDVPANGRKWSLHLTPGWLPDEGFAETSVTGLDGNWEIILTFEAKSVDWDGFAEIKQQPANDTVQTLNRVDVTKPVWTKLNVSANVSLKPSDRIIVHLSAGSTEVVSGHVLFDNIYLQKQKVTFH